MLKMKLFSLIAILALTAPLYADVKLPAIFGDHMVLQQKSSVAVWGWADPGEKVTVKGSWNWFGKSIHADADGKWSVKIKTPKAGKPVSLTVKGDNEIVLNDILLGEVWICSGQSNMRWMMEKLGTDHGNKDIKQADYPNIRLFTVERAISATPKKDIKGSWRLCSPESVKSFSATGYYFGKNLNQALNVPIGLVSTNWGGTKAEAWTSRRALECFEQFSDELTMLDNPEEYKTATAAKNQWAMKRWEKQTAKIDIGVKEAWFKPDFDDSDWNQMLLPSLWTETDLAEVDGIVWFRRDITLPPSWAQNELELHLGPIDDIDTLWVNGAKIGTAFGWDKPRVYQIPASALRIGKNSLVIRVIDTAGRGGFSGKKANMRIGPIGADTKTCSTVAGQWSYKLSRKGAVPALPMDKTAINQNTATVLYNGMIAPLIPYRIAGAIWYQGEANCYDPIGYRTLFPAMISDWRKQWGQDDFPFYYVQIAPFIYGNKGQNYSQALREAQMMTLDAVDNVGMAVLMDIGEEKNIHPKNKHDVGDRLARWALAKTYGKTDIAYSGPIYKDMVVEDGTIRVSFDHAKGGLASKDGKLTDFMIAGADKQFVPAEAGIDGETIVVSSPAVKEPVAVRYGWSNWVSGSLFNKAGLPASSFRTDDWLLQSNSRKKKAGNK